MCDVAWLWLVKKSSRGHHAQYAAQLCFWHANNVGNFLNLDTIIQRNAGKRLKIPQPLKACKYLDLGEKRQVKNMQDGRQGSKKGAVPDLLNCEGNWWAGITEPAAPPEA